MEFIIGALVVAIIWMFFSTRSKINSVTAFNAKDWAESWFSAKNINSSSLIFSSYDNPALTRNPGATVLVGTAKNMNGDDLGFVIEVISGKGVLVGEFLNPWGIATWHRMASQDALLYGKPLIDVLLDMAKTHRAKHR